nr:multiheme c-type cytochrome [uncultured Desulfobacter sp.]
MNKKHFFVMGALVTVFLAHWTQAAFARTNAASECIRCHRTLNPSLVKDWELSSMAVSGMKCTQCHGSAHTNETDSKKAVMPNIKVCGTCHTTQAKRFTMGKHGKAEAALSISAMGKKVKAQASGVFDKSCATCHNSICKDGGRCNACHGSHRFSAREARKPEACLPCHMGNHPQYEAYGNSRHGALYRARGLDGSVPTCATCHMPDGDHMVKTSWGFFGVRGEEPDPQISADQETVKGAVEMLGPILAPDSFRPDMAEWTEHRNKMVEICSQCHAKSPVRENLAACDNIVAQANHLAAGFIKSADKLKEQGILDQKEYFWLIRDKMHAQRMGMYISAFHQSPEGVLLELIHFKRATMAVQKQQSEKIDLK